MDDLNNKLKIGISEETVDFYETPMPNSQKFETWKAPGIDISSGGGEPEENLSQSSPRQEREFALDKRHPDWPHIKLRLFLGPHGTLADMKGLDEQMKNADIYIYEGMGSKGYRDEIFQEVANTDKNTTPPVLETIDKNPVLAGSFIEQQLRSLWGSNVIIGHMDVRPDDPVTVDDFNAIPSKTENIPDFDKTLERIYTSEKKDRELQGRREDIMVIHFEEEIGEILKKHPDLMKKPELNVLSTVGSDHPFLFNKFKGAGVDTERIYAHMPNIVNFDSQVGLKIALGKEPSRDELAKAFLNGVMLSVVNLEMTEPVANNHNLDIYLRHVESQFTTPEIEEIHRLMVVEDKLDRKACMDLFQKKGLDPLPQNNEQLNAYAEKYLKRSGEQQQEK